MPSVMYVLVVVACGSKSCGVVGEPRCTTTRTSHMWKTNRINHRYMHANHLLAPAGTVCCIQVWMSAEGHEPKCDVKRTKRTKQTKRTKRTKRTKHWKTSVHFEEGWCNWRGGRQKINALPARESVPGCGVESQRNQNHCLLLALARSPRWPRCMYIYI